MTHLIGERGICVNCDREVRDWNEECIPKEREPRTPFHGKLNEPITFRPQDVPKT